MKTSFLSQQYKVEMTEISYYWQVLILGSTLDLQVGNREEKWTTLRKAEIIPPNLNTIQTFYIMASFSWNVSCFVVSSPASLRCIFPFSRIICRKGFSNLKTDFLSDMATFLWTLNFRHRWACHGLNLNRDPTRHAQTWSKTMWKNQFCFRMSSSKNYSIKPNRILFH